MITIKTVGLEEVLGNFKKLKENINDMKEPLGKVGKKFKSNVDKSFETSTDPYGKKWKDVLDVTLERRQVNKQDTRPLLDTLLLKNSVKSSSFKSKAKLFTSVDYAEEHNDGLKGQDQRTFIPMNELPDKWFNQAHLEISKHLLGSFE